MNYIQRFFSNLEANPKKVFVTEMHGAAPVPTTAAGLLDLVTRFRGALRSKGVLKGDRVVLLAPNSVKWIAADLAALAEGAIVVPMYARQDPDELVEMMHDCEPTVVMCADDVLAKKIKSRWKKAPTQTFERMLKAKPLSEPVAELKGTDVSTIIYTSGTSGVPKGVMLSLTNIEHMLPVTSDRLEELRGVPGGSDRVFHYLPFCFAGSRVVLWTCLYRNNGIHLSTDLDDLANEFKAAKPHYFLNVPVLLERIKNGVEAKLLSKPAPIVALYKRAIAAFNRVCDGEASFADKATLKLATQLIFSKVREGIGRDLECLICGSAPLGADTQRWFEMLGIPVYQVYGLTETTAIATMDKPRAAVPGRVGVAIPGCDIKLGEGDEMLLNGPHIFVGYWNKEDATKAAFTKDGWFRTGDQGDKDEDGNWRIVGRVKNLLVPTSGHNVAPEPIEQMIVERTPGVEHAVLMGHGKPFITAVISGEVDADVLAASIEAVNSELPYYRRVRDYVLSDEIFTPENGLLTANTKLKRSALEAHFKEQVDALYAKAVASEAKGKSKGKRKSAQLGADA